MLSGVSAAVITVTRATQASPGMLRTTRAREGHRPLGVADLDEILARLAAHGIGHEPVETYGSGVRHVEVLDPDGSSPSLVEIPAS